jgi:hypothetical protein
MPRNVDRKPAVLSSSALGLWTACWGCNEYSRESLGQLLSCLYMTGTEPDVLITAFFLCVPCGDLALYGCTCSTTAPLPSCWVFFAPWVFNSSNFVAQTRHSYSAHHTPFGPTSSLNCQHQFPLWCEYPRVCCTRPVDYSNHTVPPTNRSLLHDWSVTWFSSKSFLTTTKSLKRWQVSDRL